MKTTVTLLILFTLFSPNTFAQDSPQWGLPDGATARLGKGTIYGNIAYSPDGTRLAVASGIGIWLYDTATHQEIALLTGHTGTVFSVSYSPDGNSIASGSGDHTIHTIPSGSGDNTIRLWDAVTGAHKHTLTGHRGYVASIAYSPDGNSIASASWNSPVHLWDAVTGVRKQILTGHRGNVTSVVYSPDGNSIASASGDGTVLLWDIPSTPTQQVKGDVTGDGMVNIQDLVLVAGRFGQTGQNDADVNGDGVVNIQDLVLVAGAFANAAAASSLHPQALAMLTVADVQGWLTQAQQMGLTDPAYLRGIAMLEQLLAALTPKETILLPNYPNPFNPETWIPYHLARAANVQVTVYDTKGAVVRQLDLGHQSVGYYTARSKAAYWDGRNDSGESVASGIYFYQLRAGRSGLSVPHRRDYTAMRRMAIVK